MVRQPRRAKRVYRDDDCRLDLERRQVAGSALLTSPTRWL